MTLSELKRKIDFLCELGHGEKDVFITLSEKSVGVRASAGISGINAGIDWEARQVRISPDRKLISYDKDRDQPIQKIKWDLDMGNGKTRHLLICPKCNSHLRKDDRYCSSCGQRLR